MGLLGLIPTYALGSNRLSVLIRSHGRYKKSHSSFEGEIQHRNSFHIPHSGALSGRDTQL